MDKLLTKVEELSVELHEKESDLEHFKMLNVQLHEAAGKAKGFEKHRNEALVVAKSVLSELQNSQLSLKSEINSLSSFSNDVFLHLTNSISDINSRCNGPFLSLETCLQKNSHMKVIIFTLQFFLKDVSHDLNSAVELIKQLMSSNADDGREVIKKSFDYDNAMEKIPSIESPFVKCQEVGCCEIFADSDSLHVLRQNLLHTISVLVDYQKEKFKNSEEHDFCHEKLLKEIDNYKTLVVPQLEATVEKLETKIREYSENPLLEGQKIITENNPIQMAKESEEENSSTVLKTQLSEAETKMFKFKQVALKLKRELADTKKSCKEALQEKEKFEDQVNHMGQELDKMSSVHCQNVQNYQSLQNEYDKLQDESEAQKAAIKKLEEDLTTALQDLNAALEQVTELESQLKKSKQHIDSSIAAKQETEKMCAELESKVIILESKCCEKMQKIQDLDTNIVDYQKEANAFAAESQSLKRQLELALKEGNKKNLLDLEIADYDRSIAELNYQVQKKDNEISELQNEWKNQSEIINCLQEEIKSTETLKETEGKRAASLKEVLDKTKTELASIKQQEAELTGNMSALQVQLEVIAQQKESCKLQLSETSAEVQRLKDIIKTSTENHQRIVRSLESKISAQKQEILIVHKEVESVKQEFESYKVRVHSVLKQQKVSNPPVVSVEADLKEELETMNDKLKGQIKDLSEKLRAVDLEYDALQEEHEHLLQRYNKAVEDLEKKDLDWHIRLEQLNSEKNRLRVVQEELSSQHLLQNEMLVSTYKKQMKIMCDEHKQTVADLQKQLDAADIEISRLQRDQQKNLALPLTPTVQENAFPFDILTQERQEGEGSESTDGTNTPVKHLSLATIPTSGFLPFEKLLQSPIEPGTPASFMSNLDSEKLSNDLNTAYKKIDHLSELLNESESTNLRLSEQVRVLKDEVRRLERNKEREEHSENLEYLKNVFVKFATLQPCSEKAMLIPVLSTMLKLSPLEQQQLKSIAGDVDPADATGGGNSWGNYLHRWSGLI